VARNYEPSWRPLPLPGLSIFRKHRFVVVAGERVACLCAARRQVEPGFDDWPDRFGRVAGGIHAHASFPQPEVAQDAFDDVGLVDEGDDPHLLAQGATPSGLSFGQAISLCSVHAGNGDTAAGRLPRLS